MKGKGLCVACERYIGSSLACPYCDCDALRAPTVRALRLGAPALALGGLALLHAWARATPPPLAHACEVAPLIMTRVVALPAALRAFTTVRAVLQPHLHWILWCGIAFILLSERPRTAPHPGACRAARLLRGWASPMAGLATFALSGWLGLLLFQQPPAALEYATQGLPPALAGLFVAPWLLQQSLGGGAKPAHRHGMPRSLAGTSLACLCVLAWQTAGWAGAVILLAAVCIGVLPMLFGTRRMNCLGVVLLPLACSLSGLDGRLTLGPERTSASERTANAAERAALP